MPFQSESIRRIACSNSAVLAFQAIEPVSADEAHALMRYICDECSKGALASILITFPAGDAGAWLGDLLRSDLPGCCRVALVGGTSPDGARVHVRSFDTTDTAEAWDFVRAKPISHQGADTLGMNAVLLAA